MEERYDEEYWYLITRLKDSFTQDPNHHDVKRSVFDRLSPNKQKLIEELPLEEQRKLADKACRTIVDIDFLTETEEQILNENKSGRKQNYKQVICRLTGKIDLKRIGRGYAELLESYPLLRTVFFYKGLQKPVKVVYENTEKVFPLHDMQKTDRRKLIFLMKNVLASEMRRNYNIESDSVLRIQGYLTGINELLVVISFNPYICYPIGIRNMLYKIFGGMDVENAALPGVNEEEAQQMNRLLTEKCVAYWKETLLPLGKSMTIPGEKRQTDELDRDFREQTVLYKEFRDRMTECLRKYCGDTGTSPKSVLLYAWANLLGKLHEERCPVMLTAGTGEELKLFPIKAERKTDVKEAILTIDRQIKEAEKYSNCTVNDIEKAVGISFAEYFRMIHNFVDFNELDEMEAVEKKVQSFQGLYEEDCSINLCVDYYLFEDKIGINYTAKKGYIEIILDNLNELFLDELSGILSLGNIKFDKKSFIRVDDTKEEKLRKIKTAQTALFLKSSGIFDALTADEMIMLARHCRLGTYLSGDEILLQGSRISSLYIVGEGKLEESMMALDGMVKSLRIIGSGSIFGVESLFERKTTSSAYTVVSSQARIVEINKNVLAEVFSQKPDGLLALLQKEHDQKCKLQRLWTMD